MPYRKLFSTLVCLVSLLLSFIDGNCAKADHEAPPTREGASSSVALPPPLYYRLAAFPATVPVARGGSGSTTIQVFPGREKKRVDTLSASGLPPGVTASFTRIFPSIYLWTVTLHAAFDTIDGSYPVRITGSGEDQEASVLVTVNISAEAKLLDNGFEVPWEWSCSVLTGTSPLWSTVTSGAYPGSSPRSGASMASFNSYTAAPGDQSLYHLNTGFTGFTIPAAVSTAALKFWMYHDTFQSNNDTVRACISTDGGNYEGVGPTVPLNDGSTGWTEVNVDLTSYKGQSNVRVGFLGTREQGSVIYLDDVTVVAEAMSSTGLAVTAQPPAVTVAQGTSAHASIITTVYGGYNSALSLTAAGLPSGVTAAFDTATIAAPGNGSATVTFTASDTAPLGSYPITISCAGGSGTEQATVTLTVTSTFSLTSSASEITVSPVSPATVTVTTRVTGGFNSPVAFDVHGLPYRVTATPIPATIAAPGGGTATITFTAGTGANIGRFPLEITGSGGGVTQRVGLVLMVHPDTTVTLAVSPVSLSIGQLGMKKGLLTFTMAPIFRALNSTATLTVSGLPPEVSGTLNPALLADSGVSTITLTAGPAAPPGSYPVTFTGTVDNRTVQAEMNLTVFADAPPNFSIPGSGTFEFLSELYGSLPEGSDGFALARNRVVAQSPTLEKELSLTLKGGYDSAFASVDGASVIEGPLILKRGKLTLERFIIR